MVEGIASVETPDDYTVKVTMKDSFVPFLTYAGNNELMMVPRELVDAGISDKQAIGYGPFRVDTAQKGSVYKLRKNPDFFLKDDKLNDAFLKGADASGLVQLKGHRVVGGMRASIYNAMPLEGVQALVAFLKDFEARHG